MITAINWGGHKDEENTGVGSKEENELLFKYNVLHWNWDFFKVK